MSEEIKSAQFGNHAALHRHPLVYTHFNYHQETQLLLDRKSVSCILNTNCNNYFFPQMASSGLTER